MTLHQYRPRVRAFTADGTEITDRNIATEDVHAPNTIAARCVAERRIERLIAGANAQSVWATVERFEVTVADFGASPHSWDCCEGCGSRIDSPDSRIEDADLCLACADEVPA